MNTHDVAHDDEAACTMSPTCNRENTLAPEGPPDYRKEKERLNSYPEDWEQGSHPTKEELAKNGMFYNHDDKQLTCIFCTMNVTAPWTAGETVKDVHVKNNVICLFMEGKFVENVFLGNEEEEIDGETEDFLAPNVNVDTPPVHTSYQLMRDRLNTFLGFWSTALPQTAKKLACSGFFTERMNDDLGWRIICYYCGKDFTIREDTKLTPWQIHNHISSTCPLVVMRQAQLSNTSLVRNEPTVDQEVIQDQVATDMNFNQDYASIHEWRENEDGNQPHNSIVAEQSYIWNNQLTENADTSKYANKETRLSSFEINWIYALRFLVKPMAKSGFFCTGYSDNVCCFACGVKIGNWRYNQVPNRRHALRSPQCPFLLKRKGKKFVVDVLKKAPRKIVMMGNKILFQNSA